MKITPKTRREIVILFSSNNYDTLKTVWIVIMGASLSNAASELAKYFTENRELNGSFEPTIVLFVLFLMIFMRFFWGDNRYIDWKYAQSLFIAHKIMEEFESLSKNEKNFDKALLDHSSANKSLDIYFLIIQSVIFVLLGNSVSNYDLFISLFIVLLVVNIVWILLGIVFPRDFSMEFIEEDLGVKMGGIRTKWPAILWVVNNTIALILFSVNYFVFENKAVECELWIGTSIVLINNLVSLTFAHTFYFPDPKKLYNDL